MDMTKALDISARGMDVQTTRLRVIAENLANQDTTGSDPRTEPTGARPSPSPTRSTARSARRW